MPIPPGRQIFFYLRVGGDIVISCANHISRRYGKKTSGVLLPSHNFKITAFILHSKSLTFYFHILKLLTKYASCLQLGHTSCSTTSWYFFDSI